MTVLKREKWLLFKILVKIVIIKKKNSFLPLCFIIIHNKKFMI